MAVVPLRSRSCSTQPWLRFPFAAEAAARSRGRSAPSHSLPRPIRSRCRHIIKLFLLLIHFVLTHFSSCRRLLLCLKATAAPQLLLLMLLLLLLAAALRSRGCGTASQPKPQCTAVAAVPLRSRGCGTASQPKPQCAAVAVIFNC